MENFEKILRKDLHNSRGYPGNSPYPPEPSDAQRKSKSLCAEHRWKLYPRRFPAWVGSICRWLAVYRLAHSGLNKYSTTGWTLMVSCHHSWRRTHCKHRCKLIVNKCQNYPYFLLISLKKKLGVASYFKGRYTQIIDSQRILITPPQQPARRLTKIKNQRLTELV